MFFKHLQIFLSLSAVVASHFVLQVPLSLGFNDTNEIISPCDSFDPLDRSGGVTDWPVAGSSIVVLTTHLDVVWEFKAALLSDVAAGAPIWRPITLQLSQQGVGTFCEPQIPGPLEWIGLDAVLQIVQHAPDGLLYQCAAIRFQNLPFAGPDPSCTNDTGIVAQWIGGSAPSSSSSVVLPTSSSSTPEGPTSSSTTTPEGPTSSSTTTPQGPTSSSSTPVRPTSSSSATNSPSTSSTAIMDPTTSKKPTTTGPDKESTASGGSAATGTKTTTNKVATTTAGGAPTQTPAQFTGTASTLFTRVEVLFFGCSLAIFVALGM